MVASPWLWALFTVIAAFSQTVRNAAQRQLTATLGTVGATINRTLKSFALAIVGAEYVLGWLPRGTHRWDKFVTPDELEAALARRGLRVIEATGVVYDLLGDRWQLASDMDVNYMLAAEKLA